MSQLFVSDFKKIYILFQQQTTTPHFVHLVDNFAKPVMCLLTDVIDWFVVNGIDYEPESIYTDVRVSSTVIFRDLYIKNFLMCSSKIKNLSFLEMEFWAIFVGPRAAFAKCPKS